MSGILYLVSTPIGNLGDMTHRAVEVLKEADSILAEDTRHSRKLLTHFGIQNTLIAYHDHNKERVTPALIERIVGGETLALVTDAGTPSVSDPGFYIVRAAIAAEVVIRVIPGANAILPALLLSGFPTDSFIFDGFLPRKKGELARKLASYADETRTVICFVSRYQLVKVLAAIRDGLPEREIAVAREITKLHEETRRGTAEDVHAYFEKRAIKGEIVLLIKGHNK